eukprot:2014168-Prymnesium_polylepis.1
MPHAVAVHQARHRSAMLTDQPVGLRVRRVRGQRVLEALVLDRHPQRVRERAVTIGAAVGAGLHVQRQRRAAREERQQQQRRQSRHRGEAKIDYA